MVSTNQHLNLKNLDQVQVPVQVVTGGTRTHSLVPPLPSTGLVGSTRAEFLLISTNVSSVCHASLS